LNPRPADYELLIISNIYIDLQAKAVENKGLEFLATFMMTRLFLNRVEQIWSNNLTLKKLIKNYQQA